MQVGNKSIVHGTALERVTSRAIQVLGRLPALVDVFSSILTLSMTVGSQESEKVVQHILAVIAGGRGLCAGGTSVATVVHGLLAILHSAHFCAD